MIGWLGEVCVCIGGQILTLGLQGRRPEEIWSKLTGAPQRVSILCYAEHSFPLQREVSDRPWMGKGGRGRTRTLEPSASSLTAGMDGARGTGADEPSMDSAMFPTESRGLWISCMEGEGGGRTRWEWLSIPKGAPHCHVSPNGTRRIRDISIDLGSTGRTCS